jgi:hypothetical protein
MKDMLPTGSRKVATLRRYLGVVEEEVTLEKWREVIQWALKDAVNPKHFNARVSGRAFLKSILIPSDPATTLTLFAPGSVTIADIKGRLAEIRALQSEIRELASGEYRASEEPQPEADESADEDTE